LPQQEKKRDLMILKKGRKRTVAETNIFFELCSQESNVHFEKKKIITSLPKHRENVLLLMVKIKN